jgi:predicted nucleic acid-binding protein
VRLVLDTNVLVAAMRSPEGASAQLVDGAKAGLFPFLVTPALFLEYEAVLTRADHLRTSGQDEAEVIAALADMAHAMERVIPWFKVRPQLPDPDDEFVLEAAVNGFATAIVTMEMRTFKTAAARFGIDVLTPRDAWVKVKP